MAMIVQTRCKICGKEIKYPNMYQTWYGDYICDHHYKIYTEFLRKQFEDYCKKIEKD